MYMKSDKFIIFQDPMSSADATFSLLDEEEERDEVGPSSNNVPPITKGRPSLRSISLSQAPSAPRDLENGNGQASCAELHKMAAGSTTSLTSQSKNAKKVNKFYKKQNELLENFKNDSEQIEVSDDNNFRNHNVCCSNSRVPDGGPPVRKTMTSMTSLQQPFHQ